MITSSTRGSHAFVEDGDLGRGCGMTNNMYAGNAVCVRDLGVHWGRGGGRHRLNCRSMQADLIVHCKACCGCCFKVVMVYDYK